MAIEVATGRFREAIKTAEELMNSKKNNDKKKND